MKNSYTFLLARNYQNYVVELKKLYEVLIIQEREKNNGFSKQWFNRKHKQSKSQIITLRVDNKGERGSVIASN